MPRSKSITFSNLICRFGDDLGLLDLAQDVVIPAFMDTSMKRKYADTSYFFHHVKIAIVQSPSADSQLTRTCIYGQFVKNSILQREQLFSTDQGLFRSPGSLPTAPSSFFVLVLENHKLIYVGETIDPPSLGAFEATLQSFLTRKYTAFIEDTYERLKGSPDKSTKKDLRSKFPHPDLKIVPLASSGSIEQFLQKFVKLKHLEFQLLDTNSEYQMRETYQALRATKREMHARKAKVVYESGDGLDPTSAAEQITAAAATGNQNVIVSGEGQGAVMLKGSNNDFQLRVEISDLPEQQDQKAIELVKAYLDRVEQGIIAEDVGHEVSARISSIRARLTESEGSE